MRRKLLTLCSGVSLLLCVAACGAWARSYFAADAIGWMGFHGVKPPPYSHGVTSWSIGWRSGGLRVGAGHSPADTIFVAPNPDDEGFTYRRWDDTGYPRLVPDGTMRPLLLQPDDWYRRMGTFEVQLTDRRSPPDQRQWVYQAVVPLWAAALAAFPLPMVRIMRWRRRRSRERRGLCPACGYDLRASAGRCPECGAAAISN